MTDQPQVAPAFSPEVIEAAVTEFAIEFDAIHGDDARCSDTNCEGIAVARLTHLACARPALICAKHERNLRKWLASCVKQNRTCKHIGCMPVIDPLDFTIHPI